ncbi:MAG: hypothetical protein OEZ00_07390, partial [Dehalococcoidia bacterium]|nr:hypothetical protein [Dehalococcoidia bacterium]
MRDEVESNLSRQNLNVYVTQGVAPGVPLETVFRGVLPFLVPFAVAVILIIAFPQIANFLPSFIS